jgi:RimJ/RimL family protein N-acetyltransferase
MEVPDLYQDTSFMQKIQSRITPELHTARLRLRPLTMDDSEAFFDIFSDVETMQYWSGEPISEQHEAETLVREDLDWSKEGMCMVWAVALPDSNRLIGKFILFQFSEQNRRAEVGYILDRRHWGRGYMSEVMASVLDYAFNVLELHRLEADTDPENTASLAILEKFGFQREGLFRQRWHVYGKWLDSVMLGLLRKDYDRL